MGTTVDIRLDPNTHDLDLTTYDLRLVTGIDRVRQLLAIRLWFFHGEWKFDKSKGIDWYTVLGTKYQASDLEIMVKDTILRTEDVLRVTSYSQSFNNRTRKVSIAFSVATTFGPLSMVV